MKFMMMIIFLSVSAFAQSPPAKILYVGAVSINPCQDAKVLADWYTRFGIETKEYHGGYYGKLNAAAGLFAFGIHPKKPDAPKKCSASVSIVYRVENLMPPGLETLKTRMLLSGFTANESYAGTPVMPGVWLLHTPDDTKLKSLYPIQAYMLATAGN